MKTGSKYIPIDCNYYDHIEATIVRKKAVELIFSLENGEKSNEHIRILDTQTAQDGEYIILESGEKIRMDRIISLDGTEAPEPGSFC